MKWRNVPMDNKTAQQIAQHATNALLYELALYPKPGLVDPLDNGAHHDMDVTTFIKSATALTPYFEAFAQAGLSAEAEQTPKALFAKIRRLGVQAEKTMFVATDGINTHKGAIFSFALFCAGTAAIAQRQGGTLAPWTATQTKDTFTLIQAMTQELLLDFKDLETKSNLSYGETLYVKYGLKGIRGEASAGYPALQDYGLPFMRRTVDLPWQTRLLDLFLELLGHTTDSNIIHRSDMATLKAVQQDVQNLAAQGGVQKLGVAPMTAMNQAFITKNISPGGTADLIAGSVFFSFLEKIL